MSKRLWCSFGGFVFNLGSFLAGLVAIFSLVFLMATFPVARAYRADLNKAASAPTVAAMDAKLAVYEEELKEAQTEDFASACFEKHKFDPAVELATIASMRNALNEARSADLQTQTSVLSDMGQRVIPNLRCYGSPICIQIGGILWFAFAISLIAAFVGDYLGRHLKTAAR